MKKQTKFNLLKISLTIMVLVFSIVPAVSSVFAQENVNGKYRVGERVECDFSFNGTYPQGTVVEVVGKGDELTCCRYRVKIDNDDPLWKDGRLCSARNTRSVAAATTENANQTKTEPKKNTTEKNINDSAANRVQGKYNSGDRVACQPTPKIGAYRNGTVVSMMEDGRYRVRFDDEPLYPEGIICSPDYMRPTNEAAPPIAECPFNKDYIKVSNNAAPSAELFKGVIFQWQNSISKFQDFGLTFLDFKMGKAFKNRVYPGVNVRRDVDAAPPGATIYPIKVKELACQKDITITLRSVTEIEYSCFKNKFGEWVCYNGAPIKTERSSIPNK